MLYAACAHAHHHDAQCSSDYAAADRLVSGGLRDLGYDTLVVTCHGWQRDPATKRLRANPKTWPNGYKALVDYAHARGLKVTAYASTGKYNCCPAFEGVMEPGAEKTPLWINHSMHKTSNFTKTGSSGRT